MYFIYIFISSTVHGMNEIKVAQSSLDLCYLLNGHKCKTFCNILECSLKKLNTCNEKPVES